MNRTVRFRPLIVVLMLAATSFLAVPTVANNLNRSSLSTPQRVAKIQVTGTVVDENGEPLIGASIRDKQTNNGMITDAEGKFKLSIAPGNSLIITCVGYTNKEFVFDGKTPIKIKLDPDERTLNEVVVVGYGVQKKINLSGSVDQLSASQLEQKPITDLARGLQGMQNTRIVCLCVLFFSVFDLVLAVRGV